MIFAVPSYDDVERNYKTNDKGRNKALIIG